MIPAEKVARMREVAQMIAADAEADVARWDGAELTGKNVAAMHGELCAVVQALAKLIDAVLEDMDGAS